MAKRPNPDLVKYIEHHLEKGFEIKNIKRKLAEVGHPIEAIEEAAQYVLREKPLLRKKPTKFLIIYGIILILAISVFAYYIWFKSTEQLQYTETVKQIETNQSYKSMADIQLLKLAASGNDIKPCDFVESHNYYYACIGRYWLREDCSWEQVIGADVVKCRWDGYKKKLDQAVSTGNVTLCSQTYWTSDCLASIAVKSNDVSVCKGDTGCVTNFSVTKKDKNACSVLSSRIFDHDGCIYSLALSMDDKHICDDIISVGRKISCNRDFETKEETAARVNEYYAEQIAKIKITDYELFRKTLHDTISYYKESICSLINGEYLGVSMVDLCYLNAAYSKNVSTCGSINDSKVKDCCLNKGSASYIKDNCAEYIILPR